MEKNKLVICDTEEGYARKMYEYMQSKYSDIYEIMLFTNELAFAEYVKENYADFLLLSNNSMRIEIPDKHVGQTVVLSDSQDYILEEPAVYKYSSADSIMQEVMSLYATTDKMNTVSGRRKGEKIKVIGIYTPIRRSFQTTFALTLGQILAKDSKTLYLNFESFSGFDVLSGKLTKTDLLDLVYFAECAEDSFSYRLNSITESIGNLDYIPPTKVYTRFSEINKDQWLKLIDVISEKTEYEFLILDLSEHVVGLFEILDRCDRIYTITSKERTASAKMAHYENMIREGEYKSILDRTSNIDIPYFREIPSAFEMLPYSELAVHIKNILKSEKSDELWVKTLKNLNLN